MNLSGKLRGFELLRLSVACRRMCVCLSYYKILHVPLFVQHSSNTSTTAILQKMFLWLIRNDTIKSHCLRGFHTGKYHSSLLRSNKSIQFYLDKTMDRVTKQQTPDRNFKFMNLFLLSKPEASNMSRNLERNQTQNGTHLSVTTRSIARFVLYMCGNASTSRLKYDKIIYGNL